MSDVYESIVAGLQEAIEDAKSKEKKLPRRVVTVVPVKEYNASEVKKIRNETGMSQKTFASYLGVSCKTVEAWESGIIFSKPSSAYNVEGSKSRKRISFCIHRVIINNT